MTSRFAALAFAVWSPAAFAAAGADLPQIFGIPVDFILFGLTLVGVALFHRYTLQVALIGLAVITLYKLMVTGFKTGPGFAGLAAHMGHEWVILANLLGLLLGFAILSKHFEESEVPKVLPRFLPDDWKGGFMLLVMVFVLSSFLDNIAAALIGGTMAHTVFRGKVHIGYLAAIVAASNAGGAGSVVGDTTTTMMWIDGVSPLAVLDAYVAASVALVVCGIPAALQQQRYPPIMKDEPRGTHVDWARVGIVAFILLAAIGANVAMNLKFPWIADYFPVIGAAVWVAILLSHPGAQARLDRAPAGGQGVDLPARARHLRVADAGRAAAGGVVADRLRARIRLRGVRQHPAHRARAEAGRLRLGHARVRRGVRRVDDLVRLVGRGCDLEHVPGSEIRRALAQARLARGDRVRHRLPRHARAHRVAPDPEARVGLGRATTGRDRSGHAGAGSLTSSAGRAAPRRLLA